MPSRSSPLQPRRNQRNAAAEYSRGQDAKHPIGRGRVIGARRRQLPRWRQAFIWQHAAFSPTVRNLDYLREYRVLVAERRPPTLARLAAALGVRRQTVWQMEQGSLFKPWLVTELRLAHIRQTQPRASDDGRLALLLFWRRRTDGIE